MFLAVAAPVTSDSADHLARGEDLAIDIGLSLGAAFVAPHGGVIGNVGWMGDCGLAVEEWWQEDGSGWQTRYCHFGDVAVAPGDSIVAGQPLGTVGMTGLTTGPHIHIVLWKDGVRVRPEDYLNVPLITDPSFRNPKPLSSQGIDWLPWAVVGLGALFVLRILR